jgi:hypothetical protein
MNPTKPKKRGAPLKPVTRKKNSTLTIRMLDDLRLRLEAEAEASGRSVSETAAHLMSLALMLNNELKAYEDIQKNVDDSIKAAMQRRGWGKVIDPRYGGAVYIPPGQHTLPSSGFMDPEQIEKAVEKTVEKAVEKALARGATLRIGGGSR